MFVNVTKISFLMITVMLISCTDSNEKQPFVESKPINLEVSDRSILCKKANNTLSDLFQIKNVLCIHKLPFTKENYIENKLVYQITHAPLFFSLQNDEFFEGEEDTSEKVLVGVMPINDQKFAFIFAQKQGDDGFSINGESIYLSVINYGQVGNQDTNPDLGLFKVIYHQSSLSEIDNIDFKIISPNTLKIFYAHEGMENEVVNLSQQ
ncbi:hypothetical protein [Acinetobacter sp. NIPH 298]|uniref:hypothetical protein n=1 Tax=Acinetobacter sp. NIPH 298 TaxID=1217692 RepID=UPI0002CED6EF|nr:hypothetical protein [Acinetobacter sp. NIPH 298]ENW97877.1 hypothetical protein F903_00401 [Acinetobacter sp. NIPH 298]